MILNHLLRLLELEGLAEAEAARQRLLRLSAADAEKTGTSLTGLVVRDEDAGLGGRWLIKFGKKEFQRPLPWTRLDVGSPVFLSAMTETDEGRWRGIVCTRYPDAIEVAFNEPPELSEEKQVVYRIDLAADEVARQRQRRALERALAAKRDRLAELRAALLGERAPEFVLAPAIEWLDANLNEPQREAVRFALGAADFAIIHGPPGTGKTTTVVELIRQAVRREWKVLACGPSNLAVDNMLERLIRFRESVVRLGHPARVLPELREHTLDMQVASHPDVKIAHELTKKAHALFAKASRYTRAKPAPGQRRELREEAREMLQDARKLEAMAVQHTLDTADVICATTTGLDDELLGKRRFDLVVIDEACQSIEPGCWIPLSRCQRLVLAGDHCQLPPTVVSPEAARGGLAVSMMERLMNQMRVDISRRLTTQYRMHEAIMAFSSREFYEDSLVADPSVGSHLLSDLPGVTPNETTSTPLEFIDTAGASYLEELEPDGDSRRNPQEAELVSKKVLRLLDDGMTPDRIGVITPYAAQARLLRGRLVIPGLEIDTVDGFQGREKEVIVISLVRSNADGDIGFLADTRRLNVALTRARRKLIVIGDSATIGGHPTFLRLLESFEQQGAYRTVWEEDYS